MALETLQGLEVIDGFDVKHSDDMGAFEAEAREKYIVVDHLRNYITFKLQKGPIKEYGVNGCQVNTLIHVAKTMIEGLNEMFPSSENIVAIEKLNEAIKQLEKRTADRIARGVEGTSNA